MEIFLVGWTVIGTTIAWVGAVCLLIGLQEEDMT
jgi:hypothetical protein